MKVAEIFAGAGGLALGLEEAGFKNVCCLEIDKWATKTLRKNRSNWQIIENDIALFVDNFSNYKFPEIDLLSGGFPCQSFSYAGKKAGFQDKRGETFHYFAKLIDVWKPKSFLIENVRGLISHQKGETFRNIIKILENKGYKIYWKILNAWNYGVSQKRERVFVVGFKQSFFGDNIQFSFPKEYEYKLNLRDALKDVPISQGVEYPQSKKKVLDLIPMGGCWRDLPEEVAKEYMKKSYFLGGGKTGMARRISWNEPSLTLTTSPQQKQTERCHPEETRPFTVREYARIQSFPDNWEFIGSLLNKYKQIGNAVPINLAKEVGLAIKKTLSSINI